MIAKFKNGDEIVMTGTISLAHDEECGRRWVTVRLEGYDIPIMVGDKYVHLLAKAEPARLPGKRNPLTDLVD